MSYLTSPTAVDSWSENSDFGISEDELESVTRIARAYTLEPLGVSIGRSDALEFVELYRAEEDDTKAREHLAKAHLVLRGRHLITSVRETFTGLAIHACIAFKLQKLSGLDLGTGKRHEFLMDTEKAEEVRKGLPEEAKRFIEVLLAKMGLSTLDPYIGKQRAHALRHASFAAGHAGMSQEMATSLFSLFAEWHVKLEKLIRARLVFRWDKFMRERRRVREDLPRDVCVKLVETALEMEKGLDEELQAPEEEYHRVIAELNRLPEDSSSVQELTEEFLDTHTGGAVSGDPIGALMETWD